GSRAGHPAGEPGEHLRALLYRAAARARLRQEFRSWPLDRPPDRAQHGRTHLGGEPRGGRCAFHRRAAFDEDLLMPATVNIHATCVVLAHAAGTFGASRDAGVLLLGKSGSGKSDLALRLISRGAILVSDDRTELCEQGGHLVAKPPAPL